MIRFENVGLRYGAGPEILRDLTFVLGEGSFHYLTGVSGAGKSSLLRLMYLALRPTRGLVHLFGHDVARTPRRTLPSLRRRVGVVFQDYRLLDHLTALENVLLPLAVTRRLTDASWVHAEELMHWVGLQDYLHARPPMLSGGQQQRLAIARAVIGQPKLLLADEPTGNVDDRLAGRLMRLFEELNRHGTSIVVATHSQRLIADFPHDILRLENGMLAPGSAGTARDDRPEAGR